MARLALTIAGAVIGAALAAYTGGASIYVGMELGALAGGLIGTFAFPQKGAQVFGPRVNDFQISSSAYGSVIPKLWGTMRLGGQIIWSQGIKEVTTTTTQSAKGGPSASQTNYTYFCSFAAVFCQGPATITRIWGDTKLIFDLTGTGVIAKDLTVFPTMYTGSETQTADPFITSIEGATVTPAYRGSCYAVWDQFPLADFGNRLPNIRAEVTSNPTASFPTQVVPWEIDNTYEPYAVITDSTGTTAYQFSVLAAGGVLFNHIQRIDLTTNTVVAKGSININGVKLTSQDLGIPSGSGTYPFSPGGDFYPGYPSVMTVAQDGTIWAAGSFSGKACLVTIDPMTFAVTGAIDLHPYYGPPGPGASYQGVCGEVMAINSVVIPPDPNTGKGGGNYIVGFGQTTELGKYVVFVVGANGGGIVGQYYGFPASFTNYSQTFPTADVNGNVYQLYSPINSFDWTLVKINILNGVIYPKGTPPLPPGPIFSQVETVNFAGDSSRGVPQGMIYNPADDSLILLTNQGAILKVDCSSMTIIDEQGSASSPLFGFFGGTPFYTDIIGNNSFISWTGSWDTGGGLGNLVQAAFKGQVQNGIFIAPSLPSDNFGQSVLVFNANDFSLNTEIDFKKFYNGTPEGAPQNYSTWMDSGAGANSWAYSAYNNSFLCNSTYFIIGYPTTPYAFGLYHCYLSRIETNRYTADLIVQDICNNAGILDENLDVSQISQLTIGGYPVMQLQAGKDIIAALAQALFFDACERDFKLTFVPRGQAAVATLSEYELGLEADKCKLTETIGQEMTLPKNVEIIFIDPAQDYQQNTQYRVRHSKTKKTVNLTSMSLPLVMDINQALQLADRIMWDAEAERRTYKTNLWKAYNMLFDPTDVIQFIYDGSTLTARITDATLGQNFASALSLTSEDSENYYSANAGNASTGFVGQTIAGLAQTLFFLLDLPYLQDVDADSAGNTGFYVGFDPATGGSWAGAVLDSSSDSATWSQLVASTTKLSYGIATTVLAAPRSPYCTDNVNTLNVRMAQGTAPSSQSALNVLNGMNVAILVPSMEVIQYQNAVLQGDGSYTLSVLFRGRRGTEWACGSHVTSETVLFPLNSGGLVHKQVSNALLNLLRYYKAITLGADQNSAAAVKAITLVGRDLMPYAPCGIVGQLTGSPPNDWTIGWFRRTRLGGDWQNGNGLTTPDYNGMDVPLNENGLAFFVQITDSSGVVKRTATVTTNSFDYTSAMQVTDFGSHQSTVYVNVYQISDIVGLGFKGSAVITHSQTLPPVDDDPPMTDIPPGL